MKMHLPRGVRLIFSRTDRCILLGDAANTPRFYAPPPHLTIFQATILGGINLSWPPIPNIVSQFTPTKTKEHYIIG